eukprot:scaffold4659_cov352-Prasinococcus_capsulatus_cf.AAC.7
MGQPQSAAAGERPRASRQLAPSADRPIPPRGGAQGGACRGAKRAISAAAQQQRTRAQLAWPGQRMLRGGWTGRERVSTVTYTGRAGSRRCGLRRAAARARAWQERRRRQCRCAAQGEGPARRPGCAGPTTWLPSVRFACAVLVAGR